MAERADRAKPMNVEADSLRYDDVNQTSVFTGRVVVTKGSIIIRGAKVDVKQDPEGYQFGLVTAEPGKRAFFARNATASTSTSRAKATPSSTTAAPIASSS
jgi:lipopolysaccharide export system protein LptA